MAVTLDELAVVVSLHRKETKPEEIAKEMDWTLYKTKYWISRLIRDGVIKPMKKGKRALNLEELK